VTRRCISIARQKQIVFASQAVNPNDSPHINFFLLASGFLICFENEGDLGTTDSRTNESEWKVLRDTYGERFVGMNKGCGF